MTDHPDLNRYDDLIDRDESDLLPVIHDLERIYGQPQPPAHLFDSIRTTAADQPLVSPSRRTVPLRSLLPSRSRLPVRWSLALGFALVLTLVGGVAYAMHTHLLGGSQPHLAGKCTGATITVAPPAYQVSSPQAYAASGGKLIPQALKQAAGMPHPQYWVMPAQAVLVDTCRGVSVNQSEIGTDSARGTQLEAISVIPFGQAMHPWPVGYLGLPSFGGCTPRPATLPLRAPDHRPVAQLERVPAGFSRSVRVVWTPCDPHPGHPHPGHVRATPVALLPPGADISFHVLSQITYQGREGAVTVIAARPSPAALRPGLNLGNPAGTRADGSKLFEQSCGGDCPAHLVQWLQNGLVVSVSGDVSAHRLKELANDVILRRS